MSGKPLLIEILEDELARRPRATPIDLRKLVMQSALGGDHLRRDPERFHRGLKEEWNRLPAWTGIDAVIQRIDPLGRTARIHLRPCREAGIALEALAQLLLSQPWKRGSSNDDRRRWLEVVDLARGGRLPFDVEELVPLTELAGAVHHSPAYGLTSYRILNDITDPAVAVWLREQGVHP